MKKLIYLFLTLFTAVAYGQADFPEGVQISGGQPTTTTDPYLTTTGTTGLQGKVAPINMPVTVTPPTTFYTPVTPDLKGHLQGIDNALGDIPLTTAGNTTRVWFTGDATTITAGTFYLTNPTSKGTVANVSQSVTNDDNQKKYFTQDLIGQPFATATLFPPGVYAGNLSASTTPNSAQQRFTVELYKCDNNGTPIASGVSGAPVGDLGVTVILILDSGLLTLADGSVTNVPVSASLASQLSVAVGERIRYHVSAEKVGTASSNITESVWYGNSFNSFLDVPTPITSSGVSNVSAVTGATVTNALDNLNVTDGLKENTANKQNSLTTDGTGVKFPTVDAINKVVLYVTPEQYGAAGDGITNDATALQNAINSGKTVVLGSKTYLTNSTLTIASVMEIKGTGNASIIKTASNLPILDIQSDGVKLSDFKILGSGRASGTDYTTTFPLQNGVKISGFYFDININKVFFDNLGNAGIYGLDNTTTSAITIKNGVNVNGCEFRNNLIGVFWDTEFEFNVVSNCYFRDNEWGIRNNAGNNAVHGGQIIRNRTGYSLESGINNAHSVVNAVHINQNLDKGIYANGVTNGHIFSNCVIFFNKVEVVNSTGITFDGGEYGTSTPGITVTNSINTTFQNINFLTTPTITESGNTNLKFFNNTFVGTRPTSMAESIDNINILNANGDIPALKMNTGSGLNSGITAMPYGGINFGNAQSSTKSPLMAGKSNDNTGLFFIGMTNDSNNQGDFVLDARENDNSDFTTLTNTAFKFSRFSTTLLSILRNGNSELFGEFTSTKLISNGLKFPATQSASVDANTLDDYEEGTFVPTIEGTTSAGAGTYTTQDGYYTKVGNLVTINIKIVWTAHTGTGSLVLRGLPFTSRKTDTQCSVYADGLTLTANNYMLAVIPTNSTSINLRQSPTGTTAANTIPVDTAATLTLSATYMTD